MLRFIHWTWLKKSNLNRAPHKSHPSKSHETLSHGIFTFFLLCPGIIFALKLYRLTALQRTYSIGSIPDKRWGRMGLISGLINISFLLLFHTYFFYSRFCWIFRKRGQFYYFSIVHTYFVNHKLLFNVISLFAPKNPFLKTANSDKFSSERFVCKSTPTNRCLF